MRCELKFCRGQLVERYDRLGRVSWDCAWCARRRAGVCRYCPRAVAGTVGHAYYCGGCKVIQRRKYVMKWQKNNLKKVAELARARRWKAKGQKMPATKMTYSARGKIGGKLGAAARIASIGAERVREIALKANAARWAKYRAAKGVAA